MKLPTNASREWSGTFKELRGKADKLARKLKEKLAEHRRQDRLDRQRPERTERTAAVRAQEKTARQASLQRLRQKAERIEAFLKEEQEKEGARGNAVQSNVTDNESAKMQTSHGVVQGYNAQALVDSQHQIIVHGAPSGSGQDHRQLAPMLAAAKEMLELTGLSEELPLEKVTLTADCNYHSEANLQACAEHRVDPYIPDNHFRSRDPRFESQERHKAPFRGDAPHARYAPKKGHFGVERFSYHSATDTYTCPHGQELTSQSTTHATGDGHLYRRYRAKARDCAGGLAPATMHCPWRRAQITCDPGRRSPRDLDRANGAEDRHPRSEEDLRAAARHRRAGLRQPAQQQTARPVYLPRPGQGQRPMAALLPRA